MSKARQDQLQTHTIPMVHPRSAGLKGQHQMAASNHLRGSTVQPRQLPASNSRRARLLVAQSKITGAKVGARTCDDTRQTHLVGTRFSVKDKLPR